MDAIDSEPRSTALRLEEGNAGKRRGKRGQARLFRMTSEMGQYAGAAIV